MKEPIFLVGDGSNLCYNTLLESVPNLVLPPEHRMHQRASGVALAARKQVEVGDPGDANALTPSRFPIIPVSLNFGCIPTANLKTSTQVFTSPPLPTCRQRAHLGRW